MQPWLGKAAATLQQFTNGLKGDTYSVVLYQTKIFMFLMQILFLVFFYSFVLSLRHLLHLYSVTSQEQSVTFIFVGENKFLLHVFTPRCPYPTISISYFRC